jgi:hypothetical protein
MPEFRRRHAEHAIGFQRGTYVAPFATRLPADFFCLA